LAGEASATGNGAGAAAVSWVVAVRAAKRMAMLKRMVISGSMGMKVEVKSWMLGKREIEVTEVVGEVKDVADVGDIDADDAVVELDRQLLIYCWFSHVGSYT
jgi:hypothetical protein